MLIWGMASLTQLLALFESGIEANIMFWIYGVGTAIPTLSVIQHALLFYAFDRAYSDLTNTDTTKASKATAVYEQTRTDIRDLLVFEATVGTVLYLQFWNWLSAQWFNLPPEKREFWLPEIDEE